MNTEKFDRITARMNKITTELHKNVELSEDMLVATEELVPVLGEATQTPVDSNFENLDGVVDLSIMQTDFNMMRSMLHQTTQNTKRVLDSVTEELIMADEESRSGLILAYSELNKAQNDAIRLFMQSYKEVSQILVNFAKVKNSQPAQTNYTTNVLTLEAQPVSVSDIVKRLSEGSERSA